MIINKHQFSLDTTEHDWPGEEKLRYSANCYYRHAVPLRGNARSERSKEEA